MKSLFLLFLLLPAPLWLLTGGPAQEGSPSDGKPKGHLVLIGGGRRTPAVMGRFLALAGGKGARIAVLPMASRRYRQAGESYRKEFQELGAAFVKVLIAKDRKATEDPDLAGSLMACTGLFIGGGDQRRLAELFVGTGFGRAVRAFHRRGGVVGGTSAGAAVMSRVMITGEGDWTRPRLGGVATREGLGLVQGAVIDQHFYARKRFNRLLALCLEKKLPGVGIDEATALWVKGSGEAQVLGEGVVLVIDPRKAVLPEKRKKGDPLQARDVRLHVLRRGERFEMP